MHAIHHREAAPRLIRVRFTVEWPRKMEEIHIKRASRGAFQREGSSILFWHGNLTSTKSACERERINWN